MGVVLSTRRYDAQGTKLVMELLVDANEAKQLHGEINDIYIFSERVANVPSRVSLRGRNEATKYFLIPTKLRKELAVHGKVSCLRLDVQQKSVFVYVLDPLLRSADCVLSEE